MTEPIVEAVPIRPSDHPPKRLRPARRRLAERGRDRRKDRPIIPDVPGDRVEQSPLTEQRPTEPNEPQREVEFTTYTPFESLKGGVLVPPDPSGADGVARVVLSVGNSYLIASKDGGSTFTEHDPTSFLPAAQGRAVDQVMIYVPHRQLFAWMMQHNIDPATGDGTFRLAVAHAEDVANDLEHAWTVYDFTSSDLGFPKVATDRQDLAFSQGRLYMTTNLTGQGRVVMSLALDDLVARQPVSWTHTKPLDRIYHFSDLSQQNQINVHSVAIVNTAALQVMVFDDAAGNYSFHDVKVGKFPQQSDLQSFDPNGVDWLTRGVANVSASVISGGDLWIAWDAAASAVGENPVYPHAHVRLARVSRTNWTTAEERQVWNPGYAFAYGCLAVGAGGEVGYGVGVGGPSDFPNSCFGILGDFVVYFRDASTATAGAGSEPRWGDYITVRPSVVDNRRFAAFGYFTQKTTTGERQQPYFLFYGRP